MYLGISLVSRGYQLFDLLEHYLNMKADELWGKEWQQEWLQLASIRVFP